MKRTQLVAALLVCALIGLPRAGSAQNAPAPTILNVTMDAAGDQITITGKGFGPAPLVTIDGQQVPVLTGSTDTLVTVVTPAVLLTTPGTYRLTVVDPVLHVGEAFVIASHAIPVVTATSAAGVAAPSVSGAVSATPQPLETLVTLTGFEDTVGALNTTAVGFEALRFNTGGDNTAIRLYALRQNGTGGGNTASGVTALFFNDSGF
jgi:IPT/TIG domain-containing protein